MKGKTKMFNPVKSDLTFQEKVVKYLLIWGVLLITLFSISYLVEKREHIEKNKSVPDCRLSDIQRGDLLTYDDEALVVEDINYRVYKYSGNELNISFEGLMKEDK